MQPYQMVKDLRTGVTKENPSAVVGSEFDDFMAAALAQRVTYKRSRWRMWSEGAPPHHVVAATGDVSV